MKKLSYQTLKELNYDGYLLESAPERVLQFGEGNFLRAFVDYFIDKMNEMAGFNSKVVVCQPQGSPLADIINEQEGLYTLFLRGFQDGQKINKKRVISCELIDNNGQELKNVYCSMPDNGSWEKNLSIGYRRKISSALRLLTGYPKKEASAICEELGYEDQLIDAGEVFAFWAIEGPQSIKEEFPFEKADLPILVTDNHKPYKQRKVRILSGAHACLLYRFLPRSYTDGRRTDWGQGRQFLYDQRRTDGSGILLCPQG